MQRQVRTIIIFLSLLLYVILAEDLSANDCSSSEQCPSTESETGVKSREACQQWKKSAPTAFSQTLINENAKNREFLHIAALGFYKKTDGLYYIYCTGSIISERYILTVAHCIVNTHRDKLKFVRIGTVELPESVERPDPAVDYNVEGVKVHEQFNRRRRLNNIALIKLEKTLTWTDFIRPACLYLKNDDPALLYYINAKDLDLGLTGSKILQKNVVKSVTLSECNVTYTSKTSQTLRDTNICATGVRIYSCQGGSGRPLQVDEPNSIISSIVGVASYANGCEGKYPDVFTRVYSYVDWIENIVWP